jgi:hypothetical protein
MRCAEVRDRLLADGATTFGKDVRDHLASCGACVTFAAALAQVRAGLHDHHAGVEPGPDFAARVVARLPGASELLGWASLRLLPAALALAALLTWYGASRGPGLSDLLLHPDDPALLTYLTLSGGGSR